MIIFLCIRPLEGRGVAFFIWDRLPENRLSYWMFTSTFFLERISMIFLSFKPKIVMSIDFLAFFKELIKIFFKLSLV